MMFTASSTITSTTRCYRYALLICSLLLLWCHLEMTTRVSAWVLSPPQQSYNRNRNRNGNGNNGVVTYSMVKDTQETSIVDVDEPSPIISSTTTATTTTTLPFPSIQYTVPGMKIGWKDSDTGVWMDEDGPRNGPPQNYWRQQSDEKLYKESMQVVQDLLVLFGGDDAAYDDDNNNDDVDNFQLIVDRLVRPIEKTNSVRRPFINRLVLNDWAPIVRGGKVVAATGASTSTSSDNNEVVDVPYFFNIQRTAGQKLGPKTPYGTFDEHLKPEEEIIIQQQQLVDDNDNDNVVVSSSGVVKASSDNENRLVKGCSTTGNNNNDDLYMGGITYIGKYLMIMRQQQQDQKEEQEQEKIVTEIWMRVDPKIE